MDKVPRQIHEQHLGMSKYSTEPQCGSYEMYSRYDDDEYINEASSWMNGASTNQWIYDGEYGMPKYSAQRELELIMDEKVIWYLYEQDRSN